MTIESKLSRKLQEFSGLDFGLINLVYLLIGILVFTCYAKLQALGWLFYLMLAVVAMIPLILHILALESKDIEKVTLYIKTNNPSNQVLMFLAMFFFGCLIASIFNVLTQLHWWYYVILIIILAIKPATTNLFW